jgi:hypothetical protein
MTSDIFGLLLFPVLVFIGLIVQGMLHVSAEHDAAREVPTLHPERAVRTIRRGELGQSVKVDLKRERKAS